MTWVRIDEEFARHPKIVAVTPLGMAMQVAGLCYCNQYLTDGFIPTSAASGLLNLDGLGMNLWDSGEGFGGGEDAHWRLVVHLLETHGLWDPVEGGWRIHDFHEYQPSKQEVLELREKRQDAGRKGGRASAQAKAQASASAKSKPVPVPEPKKNKNLARTAPRDELWDALVQELGEPQTRSERSRRNGALKELRDAGATAEQVRLRSSAYRKLWPEMSLTENALTKHWTRLGVSPSGLLFKHRCPECGIPFQGERTLAAHRANVHGVKAAA